MIVEQIKPASICQVRNFWFDQACSDAKHFVCKTPKGELFHQIGASLEIKFEKLFFYTLKRKYRSICSFLLFLKFIICGI